MKKILIPVAVIFFTGAVNAATDEEVYHGFAKGNSDLATSPAFASTRTAVQPGIGAGVGHSRANKATDNDIYRGFERGNPDLSSGSWTGHSVASVPGIGSSSGSGYSKYSDNDIYRGFEIDNQDL